MAKNYKYKYSNPFNLDGMDKSKDSIHSLPFWIGLVILLSLSLLFGIVFLIDGWLPTALTINDEAKYPDSFITDRAVQDLKYLTDLGPKITGSYENEQIVVDFLSVHIQTIIAEAHSSQFIEYDIQEATGSYYLDDATGFVNIYDKVQNIVVKVHGQNNESSHSILLNSHFDSVPISPGASDDGINVVSMLEILRKLAKSNKRLEQNVIFLFNGAEETPLQAAHGFIAHHKWANESKYIINLEACGSGGKIVLFQTGPDAPWLVKYYSKVPHPSGNVVGEEIFQSGLIPSDTDFRLFRDFGNMVGADFAFVKDGYRYHTAYDSFDNIPSGSYQHVGDNILAYVKSLANAPEVTEKERSLGKMVYFDIFGLSMITYSARTALILNLVTAAISLGVFILALLVFRVKIDGETFRYIGITTAAILASWIIAAIFVLILAVALDLLGKTMSWYANPWIIFGLYVVPTFALSGCLLYFTSHKFINFQSFSLNVRGQIQIHLVRLIWTIILVIGTLCGVRSVYIIMIPVLFNSIFFLLLHVFRLQHAIGIWLIVHAASLFVPIVYLLQQVVLLYSFFIPITGRMGAQVNPELLIGFSVLFFVIVGASHLTVLTNLLRKAKFYYIILASVFLLCLGLLFTPFAFPYSGNESSPKPQRHWIMHTQRQFYLDSGELSRTESGFFLLNMDRNSPDILKSTVRELENAKSLDDDCDQYPLCALPLIHAKIAKKIHFSEWIPASDPEFPSNETLTFKVTSQEQISYTKVKFNIEVSGPDKLIFYFTPRSNINVLSTSLSKEMKPSKITFQHRPVYIFLYQRGKNDGIPVSFDVIVNKPPAHQGAVLDIAVSARYVHQNRIQKTAAFLGFLVEFPQWTHITPWVAAYQSHVLSSGSRV